MPITDLLKGQLFPRLFQPLPQQSRTHPQTPLISMPFQLIISFQGTIFAIVQPLVFMSAGLHQSKVLFGADSNRIQADPSLAKATLRRQHDKGSVDFASKNSTMTLPSTCPSHVKIRKRMPFDWLDTTRHAVDLYRSKRHLPGSFNPRHFQTTSISRHSLAIHSWLACDNQVCCEPLSCQTAQAFCSYSPSIRLVQTDRRANLC